MRSALAIARRELGEKMFVLITAVGLSIVPFLVPLIPSTGSFNAKQLIATTAAFGAVAFSLGLAVILGATVIGRDLTERRLSFYFSRPVSPAAIWFGKMGASLLMVVLSFTVMFGPAIAFSSDQWRSSWNVDLGLFTGCVVGMGVVLLLVTHALSTMIRSRSPWLLVDFALLIIALLLLAAIILPLVVSFAFELSRTLAWVIGIALVLSLAVAGWYQLAEGRVERRQSHRALSIAFWSCAAVILAGAAGFVLWVFSARPSDVVTLTKVAQPRSGPWAIVGGTVPHRLDYRPVFLVNVEDGSSRRIGGAYPLGLDTFFTPDGRAVAWVERASLLSNRFELAMLPLTPNAKQIDTGISVKPFSAIVFSGDGDRIATLEGRENSVAIHEVSSRKLLAGVRLPDGPARQRLMFFVDRDHLRVITLSSSGMTKSPDEAIDQTLHIFEFDIARRTLTLTGETHFLAHFVGMRGNADGSRLLLRGYGSHDQAVSHRLIDGRTAATIAEFDAPSSGSAIYWILSNGTLAISQHKGVDSTIRFFAADGTPQRELVIPGMPSLFAVGEIAPGRLLVAGEHALGKGNLSQERRAWTAMVIDTAAGTIVRSEPGLNPLGGEWIGSRDPRRDIVSAPPLFIDAKRALVTWNPVTGARRTITD